MTIIFVSDLHLEEKQPDSTEIFFRFLQHKVKHAKALYILGDFFESWIGDDNDTQFNQSIINALNKTVSSGIPIYFIHGNRDFLLGKKFFKASACQLLPDEYVLNLFGIPTLLMHGDTLCIEDISYLKFRKKSRNWFFQKMFLLKSLRTRKELADRYRQASKNHISTLPDHIMDVTNSEVERIMKKNNVQHLIHGHTHRQNKHEFHLNGKPATRIVLGAWHHQGNALVCSPGGKKEFIRLC